MGGTGNDTIIGSLSSAATTTIDAGVGNDLIQVGGAPTGNKAPVVILGSTGNNQVIATNITGKIFAEAGNVGSTLGSFGTIASASTTFNATVSNSIDIDIFGTRAGDTTVDISSSQDIDIFGGRNDRFSLTNVTRATTLMAGCSVRSPVPVR